MTMGYIDLESNLYVNKGNSIYNNIDLTGIGLYESFVIDVDLDDKADLKIGHAYINNKMVRKMPLKNFYQSITSYMDASNKLHKKIFDVNKNLQREGIALEVNVDENNFLALMHYIKSQYETINDTFSKNMNNKLIKSLLSQYSRIEKKPEFLNKNFDSKKEKEIQEKIYKIKNIKENVVFKEYLPEIFIKATEDNILLTKELLKEYQECLIRLFTRNNGYMYYVNSYNSDMTLGDLNRKQFELEKNRGSEGRYAELRELCLKGKFKKMELESGNKTVRGKDKI